MRVQGFKNDDTWASYGFDTTYNMGWNECLAYAATVYEYTEGAEVLTAVIAGADAKPVEIKSADDIWNIKESGYIVVRGRNKIYDGMPFQFRFYNQLTQVMVDVPAQYIDSLKKSETELLDDEGKKHTLDKFMDSIEINGNYKLLKKEHKDDVDALVAAITQFYDLKGDDEGKLVYRNKKTGTEVNITELCRLVVEKHEKAKKETCK